MIGIIMKRILYFILAAIVAVPAVFIALEFVREPGSELHSQPVANAAEQIERGKYLARAGDCMACHSERGGKPYAGGRAIRTPFGNVYAPNITPDVATGIGSWTADDFWRALHNGKSKDGSFLYPAFPYTNYTKVTRADSDALYAYFRMLEPVQRKSREHELRFPYNQRVLLAAWRALYFKPEIYQPVAAQSVEWNRGAYLVQGLGHCSACHSERNALGASDEKAGLAGGMIPVLDWYASPLSTNAGVADWEIAHIAGLLKTGVSPRGAVAGPMAEVVAKSLQHMSDGDIRAMATYLKALPQDKSAHAREVPELKPESERVLKLGAKLYEKHCAECHQASGEGVPTAYPPLAGNRSLAVRSPVNPIRLVLNGGYSPSTAGNPRPFGMPPFSQVLTDEEVAAVVSYIRNSWGNRAEMVLPAEVGRYRGVPLE
jgi:mono/diheme cytochrome c family protein